MNWKKVLIGVGMVDLVVVNAGVGYLLVYKSQILNSKFQTNLKTSISNDSNNITEVKDAVECDRGCVVGYVEQALQAWQARQATQAMTLRQTVVPTAKVAIPKVTQKPKIRSVTYLTVPGSGSSGKNDWESLAGTEFYFDPGDYPGLADVYFEVNMKLFNGNGIAYVRLYDATHGGGVQGSEVQTNSQANSVVASGRVTFWSGKNLIKIQAKSLTADTAVFNSGRLKIVMEN